MLAPLPRVPCSERRGRDARCTIECFSRTVEGLLRRLLPSGEWRCVDARGASLCCAFGRVESSFQICHGIPVLGEVLRRDPSVGSRPQAASVRGRIEKSRGRWVPAVAHRRVGDQLRRVGLVLHPPGGDRLLGGAESRQRHPLRVRRMGDLGSRRAQAGAAHADIRDRRLRVMLRLPEHLSRSGHLIRRGTPRRALCAEPHVLGARDFERPTALLECLLRAIQIPASRVERESPLLDTGSAPHPCGTERARTERGRRGPPVLGGNRPQRIHASMLPSPARAVAASIWGRTRIPWRQTRVSRQAACS